MPGPFVCAGAMLKCAFGDVPMPLVVVPGERPTIDGMPMATLEDFVPMENIPSFAVCTAPANPETKNPTGQAPCVPIIDAPWDPGAPNVLIDGIPALTMGSMCLCQWAGLIEILDPGQDGTVVAG
jgi:uncharacterized Zn-binding protein involved in type VI secretion